jgi:hypothetical protein
MDAELADIIVPVESYTSAATIEPKVRIKNSGDFPITAATVTYTIDGGYPVIKTWEGNLDLEETVDITFNAITLTYGVHVFEATVSVEEDGNPDNNAKSKTYEVTITDAPYVNYDSHEVVGGNPLTYISTQKEIAVTLKNVGVLPANGPLNVTFSCEDPQLTITQATAQCETIAPDGTVTVFCKVTVANDIPNDKVFHVNISVSNSQNTWGSVMPVVAYAPKFKLEKVLINGVENGNLPKDALVTITAVVKNEGGAPAYIVKGNLEMNSEFITLACEDIMPSVSLFAAGVTEEFNLHVITSSNMPSGYETAINFLISALHGRSFSAPFKVVNTGSGNYCVPGTTGCNSGDRFSSVVLWKTSEPGNLLINNQNGNCVNNGYSDFTSTIVELEPGQQYTIKIKCVNYQEQIRGWFDLNGNNTFDANELLINMNLPANPELTQNFTIPENLCVPGTYRFRLRCQYNTSVPGTCDGYQFGQTHDYTIVIPELYPRVQNVVADLQGENITINWAAPEEGTPNGYNIYRNNYKLNSTLLTNTTFTEENIVNGVYAYNVTAVYESNKESYAEMSNVICLFLPELCEPPVNLLYIMANNYLTITWNEPVIIDGVLTGYEIYRNGEKIGTTNADVREYQDMELEDGAYFYQVVAVYEHCTSELSEELSVDYVGINELQTDVFQLFPNPATHEITIKGEGITQVEIYDVSGRKLSSHRLISTSSHQTINVSHLSSGVYFVKLIIGDKHTVTKRVVVI